MRQRTIHQPGAGWALLSDRVMGGVSSGNIRYEVVLSRPTVEMRGEVHLDNNDGFLQIALDLGVGCTPVDPSAWRGVQLDVTGNRQSYNIHLRTTDIARPRESCRQSFMAPARSTRVQLPFARFEPHRTVHPLRPERLRRIGLIAIGRAFDVDIAFADLRFYRAETE